MMNLNELMFAAVLHKIKTGRKGVSNEQESQSKTLKKIISSLVVIDLALDRSNFRPLTLAQGDYRTVFVNTMLHCYADSFNRR